MHITTPTDTKHKVIVVVVVVGVEGTANRKHTEQRLVCDGAMIMICMKKELP